MRCNIFIALYFGSKITLNNYQKDTTILKDTGILQDSSTCLSENYLKFRIPEMCRSAHRQNSLFLNLGLFGGKMRKQKKPVLTID